MKSHLVTTPQDARDLLSEIDRFLTPREAEIDAKLLLIPVSGKSHDLWVLLLLMPNFYQILSKQCFFFTFNFFLNKHG